MILEERSKDAKSWQEAGFYLDGCLSSNGSGSFEMQESDSFSSRSAISFRIGVGSKVAEDFSEIEQNPIVSGPRGTDGSVSASHPAAPGSNHNSKYIPGVGVLVRQVDNSQNPNPIIHLRLPLIKPQTFSAYSVIKIRPKPSEKLNRVT